MTATVRLWHFRLQGTPDIVGQALALLSQDEQTDSTRFATETLRRRFIFRRAWRRRILGKVQGVAPTEVTFEISPEGKPRLVGLDFSTSSSGDHAVLVVSPKDAIGVDVEIPRNADWQRLAPRVLTPRERIGLDHARFLKLWTAKEAVVKAWGSGLELRALSDIEVEIDSPPGIWQPVKTNVARPSLWTCHVDLPGTASVCIAATHPAEVVIEEAPSLG